MPVVVLLFDIDKKGNPINIKIERSLCTDCDQEAIRLLKEGPKWEVKKNKNGIVNVRF
jgi:5S rRNA maturation endonuclease (ribonuclease M5)